MLAGLRTPEGRELDLTLTTNGAALRALARPLADAGLRRVTVSLDSLDDAVFGAMNGVDFPVARVLDGIDAALEAGLAPVKVNMVVRRGINEGSVVPMARWARDTGVTLRFIEYMDVGHSNGWRLDEVVPAVELIDLVTAVWPAEPADPGYRGEVAGRWRFADGRGEFGIISSVTRPFCRDCTRARLSADGKLYTCLFAVAGRDVRAVLRDGSSDEALLAFLADTWRARDDRYSELRAESTTDLPKVEMFAMGG
jgi:cyclic pyranopterin phosphate synthase